MYDVIVIGARVAGSPTAMLLARKGYRVLVVDKASFPSDTVSTHMITVEGSAQLRRWGLLPQVEATGCPPITNIVLDLDFERYGHFTLTGFPPPIDDGFGAIYAPKRTVLDKLLIDAAADAGAEVRERFSVTGILTDDSGKVVGIRGRTAEGTTVTETARLVVGADGMRSTLAEAVDAPKYYTAPPLAFGYYSYWRDVPLQGLEFYTRPGSTVIAFPTNDGQSAVFIERPERDFAEFRTDLLNNYLATIDKIAPDLATRVRSGSLAHRIVGAGNRANFFRKPYGPGWALVGDAAVHKDPITAQGITDAFRDADLLAQAIDAGFSGRQSLDQALQGYEERRNDALKPLYDFIVDHAAMEPFDVAFQDVLAAMRGNQDAINRFFGVIQNTIPWSEFFSPANLSQIMGLPAPTEQMA
ncbi:NAD(P)/FAD-dependent oxidoreductase [Micromonospora sp. WMMA1998]|uniref:NAD(P)/FAD-dependent oxidoreductase n=1 Tax=Micromonospora sp. WMMA1998 TaxID=3015167 RepID=UPI00248B0862|nr:NAD(P)/FAD-dependent oxidoreductase [Micromonospora sp. WMMA1998]WBC14945.1 NAD(P)/FAD-dependent oxidoreductase [Micromonospora sp. WMMA1998]